MFRVFAALIFVLALMSFAPVGSADVGPKIDPNGLTTSNEVGPKIDPNG